MATGDYITVTEIARLALEVLGLDPAAVRFEYTGGDRGWKGDVPIVRLNTDRIRALGWAPTGGCAWALSEAMRALARDERSRAALTVGHPAVFLDRDGVLNEAVLRDGRPHPPVSADELVLRPGAAAACARLRAAGFLLVIVTNQPDIARGTTTRDAVDAHQRPPGRRARARRRLRVPPRRRRRAAGAASRRPG